MREGAQRCVRAGLSGEGLSDEVLLKVESHTSGPLGQILWLSSGFLEGEVFLTLGRQKVDRGQFTTLQM